MLSVEENDLLCRVGPGTVMGDLFRQYWLPAMLSSELPEPDGAQVRVKLLGEELIAFRDSDGDVGLVANLCPHRGASLFYAAQRRGRPSLRLPRLEIRQGRQMRRHAERAKPRATSRTEST